MRLMLNAGSLDGKSMIEMNNLAVGYFPGEALEVGVYPPPVPQQQPQPDTDEQCPVTLEQQGLRGPRTNF
jgi:hypothetical protein